MRIRPSWAGAALAALLAAGCGGPVTVKGTVTLDGQPLEGATVMFIPVNEWVGANAVTDADGRFTLIGTKADGLMPGEYKVTVSKKVWPPGMKEPPPEKLSIPMVEKKIESLPKAYTMPEATPLRQTVPGSGTRDVKIELSSKAK
jgi:hypothetical protein